MKAAVSSRYGPPDVVQVTDVPRPAPRAPPARPRSRSSRVFGAHVTAVCSSEHVDLVAGLGADRVVDRTTTDFTADTQRYDVFFDAVGKCSFLQCRELLKPRGIWTTTDLGPLSQNLLLVLATRFTRGRRVLIPTPRIDRQMVDDLKSLVESGMFTPVVDRTYTLEHIVDAYRYVETQQKVGNVVIAVAPGPNGV